MRYRSQFFRLIVFFLVLTIGNSFRDNDNLRNSRRNTHHDLLPADGPFKGAWTLKEIAGEQVVVFIDNYFTHTAYSTSAKKFVSTQGGQYRVDGNKIVVNFEFSTVDKNLVGTEASFNYSIQGNTLNTDITGTRASWAKVDDGTGVLAGNWQITGDLI